MQKLQLALPLRGDKNFVVGNSLTPEEMKALGIEVSEEE